MTSHRYRVYGASIRSPWRLPCPAQRGPALAEVELRQARGPLLTGAAPAAPDWFHYRRLPDGEEYVRWTGLFEFLVAPDGRRIACRPLDGVSREAFHTYLLAQVLSFALLKQGIEPLHATAVVVRGRAVAFLGDCGRGKSSLGAAFLRAGHALLTDDLLVARLEGRCVVAYPGPSRIKLYPGTAWRLLGARAGGAPMNPFTAKRVIPLPRDGAGAAPGPVPLGAIYVLAPPARRGRRRPIAVRRLSARRACLALLRHTFNPVVEAPGRLRRQLALAARLARRVPVKSLSFPRGLAALDAVRQAIEADLAR